MGAEQHSYLPGPGNLFSRVRQWLARTNDSGSMVFWMPMLHPGQPLNVGKGSHWDWTTVGKATSRHPGRFHQQCRRHLRQQRKRHYVRTARVCRRRRDHEELEPAGRDQAAVPPGGLHHDDPSFGNPSGDYGNTVGWVTTASSEMSATFRRVSCKALGPTPLNYGETKSARPSFAVPE